jgi:hypothetical protein
MIRQKPIQVKIKESDAAVTGFAGAAALVQVAHQTGLLAELDRRLPLKQRRRGLSPGTSVLDLMLLSCAGGECIDDLEVLRSDRGLRRLLDRPVMAPSTAHDFLRRFDAAGREGLAGARRKSLHQVAQATKQKRATLDCDASFFASGVRSARMSYLGERGWMPMMAFWAELDLIVHEEFRPGNAAPQSDAVRFLKETVAQLPKAVKEIRVRSDSAWYQAEVLDHCQKEGYGFSITADKDPAVQTLLAGVSEPDWRQVHLPPDPSEAEECLREWAFETVHTLERSEFSYRMILLRKERRQPDLFNGEYVYGAVITNLDLPLEQQLRWHRQRCNCENHIKELKHGFSMRGLPSGDFEVNAAYFRIGTLAYNLISSLKWLKLDASWRALTMKTLRFRLLALPALVVRHARRLWLHLPRGHPHLMTFRAALI